MITRKNPYVFQAVQILVTLATNVALIWLLLLHAECAGIGRRCLGIHNGESPIAILMELLSLMSMRLVVSELVSLVFRILLSNSLKAILILVRLLATDHGTLERLVLFAESIRLVVQS